jgi:hypothetical protein
LAEEKGGKATVADCKKISTQYPGFMKIGGLLQTHQCPLLQHADINARWVASNSAASLGLGAYDVAKLLRGKKLRVIGESTSEQLVHAFLLKLSSEKLESGSYIKVPLFGAPQQSGAQPANGRWKMWTVDELNLTITHNISYTWRGWSGNDEIHVSAAVALSTYKPRP